MMDNVLNNSLDYQ